jgi:hypothetical protein
MKNRSGNPLRELFTTKGRILWGLVRVAGAKVRFEMMLWPHSPFQSAGDAVGLLSSLVQPRASEKLFTCRGVNDKALARKSFCESLGAGVPVDQAFGERIAHHKTPCLVIAVISSSQRGN